MIEDGLPADSGTPHLLGDVRATTEQYLGAGVEDVLLNASPIAAINRYMERSVAGGRDLPPPPDVLVPWPPVDMPREPVAMLSKDEANQQYGDIGLKFDAPVAAQEAALIADAKKRELQAQATFRAARVDAGEGPGLGIGRSLLSVGTDLVGTMADPINAATMLLPVVGPGGRAALAGVLGRVGGAAAAGALEGSVGIGLVQPLITGEALAEQRDTSWWDGAANVVLGGVLGGALGGLHGWFGRAEPSLATGRVPPPADGARPPGGPPLAGPPGPVSPIGRFGDFAGGWHAALEAVDRPSQSFADVSRAPAFDREAPMVRALSDVSPETRRVVGETALMQYLGGREIDVEALLRLDPGWRPPASDPAVRARVVLDGFEQRAADLRESGRITPEAQRPAVDAIRGRIDTLERWLDDLDQKRRGDALTSPRVAELRQAEAAILARVGGVEDRLTKAAAGRLESVRGELGELLEPTADSHDMAKVREALGREQQRLADAAAARAPAETRPTALDALHDRVARDALAGGANPAEVERWRANPADWSILRAEADRIAARPELRAEIRGGMAGDLGNRLDAVEGLRDRTAKSDTIGDPVALEHQTADLRATPAEHAQSPVALAEHEHAQLEAEARQALEAHPDLKAELEAADIAARDADLFGKASDALAGCKITGGQ